MGRSRKKSTFDEELLSTPSTSTIKIINKSPAPSAKTNVKRRSNAVPTAMGRSRKKSTFDEELLSTPSTSTIKIINKSPAPSAKTNVKRRSNAVPTAMKDEKCSKPNKKSRSSRLTKQKLKRNSVLNKKNVSQLSRRQKAKAVGHNIDAELGEEMIATSKRFIEQIKETNSVPSIRPKEPTWKQIQEVCAKFGCELSKSVIDCTFKANYRIKPSRRLYEVMKEALSAYPVNIELFKFTKARPTPVTTPVTSPTPRIIPEPKSLTQTCLSMKSTVKKYSGLSYATVCGVAVNAIEKFGSEVLKEDNLRDFVQEQIQSYTSNELVSKFCGIDSPDSICSQMAEIEVEKLITTRIGKILADMPGGNNDPDVVGIESSGSASDTDEDVDLPKFSFMS